LRRCQAALIALVLSATACSSSPGLPTPPPLTVVAASPTSSPETAAQPTPTTVSVAAAPTSPPVPTPVPVPTAVPSPTARPDLLVVTNAGTEGVSIRRAPATGERIKTWSDGAEMVSLLEEQQAGGRSWKKVRDPDGNEGWVAADFLVARPASPAPAVAGKPNVSPDVQRYDSYVRPKLQAAAAAIRELSQQSASASQNSQLLTDPEWKRRTAASLESMKKIGTELQVYDPVPPELNPLDEVVVSLGKDLVYVADEYAAGIEPLRPERLGNAADRMSLMSAKLQRATTELQQLIAR
jgi:hypothetical protein